jgi:predicted secreted protein
MIRKADAGFPETIMLAKRGTMPVTTAIAIFFLIWWVVLFAVLPLGIRSQHESGEIVPGTDPGAPAIPNLGRKLLWTTAVSALIFAGCYMVYVERLVTLQGLSVLLGMG